MALDRQEYQRKYQLSYYHRHREKSLARMKKYREMNLEVMNAKCRATRAQDPRRLVVEGISWRAREIGFDRIYLLGMEIPTHCPVLGTPIAFGGGRKVPAENKASFDRIDSTKGYVPGNVQIISALANTMKNRASADQLHLFAKWILGESHAEKALVQPEP